MIMEQMANWLIGSILFSIGSLALIIGLILINNLLHRFWKPVTIIIFRNESVYPTMRFSNTDDKAPIEPSLDEKQQIDKFKN